MELKLNTDIGEMVVVFESTPINSYQEIYTAWFKEKPSVIVEADSINNAIDELYITLGFILEYENKY